MPQGPAVSSGNRTFDLNYFTGKVVDNQSRVESVVSGSGGGATLDGTGGSAVRISTTNTLKQTLFLQADDGEEMRFSLDDFEVHCRTGHKMTVVWPIKQGSSSGYFTHFHNHNTGETQMNGRNIASTVGKPILSAWLIFFVILIVGVNYTGASGFPVWAVLGAVVSLGYYITRGLRRVGKLKNDPAFKDFFDKLTQDRAVAPTS